MSERQRANHRLQRLREALAERRRGAAMSVTLRGVNLGYMKLDLSLLSDREQNAGVTYHCPASGHLHTDHAGGLRLFEDAGAEIVVHEREYAHVMGMQQSADFFNQVDWAFLGDKRPTLVADGDELAGGIRLHHLPGHTPVQMAMQLELGTTGTVLLASDALYHHDDYADPVAAPQIYWDVDQWHASLGKLSKIAQESDAWIFPGHDDTGIAHYDGKKELRAIQFTPEHVYA